MESDNFNDMFVMSLFENFSAKKKICLCSEDPFNVHPCQGPTTLAKISLIMPEDMRNYSETSWLVRNLSLCEKNKNP